MTTIHLSDVQWLNLSVLLTLQAGVRKDPAATCLRFGLSAEQAARIQGMGQDRLQAIVANRGHQSLFRLRDDFWQLLDAPDGLQGPLVSVRAPDAAQRSHSGR